MNSAACVLHESFWSSFKHRSSYALVCRRRHAARLSAGMQAGVTFILTTDHGPGPLVAVQPRACCSYRISDVDAIAISLPALLPPAVSTRRMLVLFETPAGYALFKVADVRILRSTSSERLVQRRSLSGAFKCLLCESAAGSASACNAPPRPRYSLLPPPPAQQAKEGGEHHGRVCDTRKGKRIRQDERLLSLRRHD